MLACQQFCLCVRTAVFPALKPPEPHLKQVPLLGLLSAAAGAAGVSAAGVASAVGTSAAGIDGGRSAHLLSAGSLAVCRSGLSDWHTAVCSPLLASSRGFELAMQSLMSSGRFVCQLPCSLWE